MARFETGEVDSDGRPIYRYEGKVKCYIARNTPRDLNAIPFCDYIDQGLLRVTESPMVDLMRDFIDDYWKYYSSDCAIDPYQAQQFAEQVEQEGVCIAAMPQTTRHFNEPIAELRQSLADGRFTHNGDPILRWMLSNAVAVRDRNDRWMYDKASSSQKIDGLVALTMAFARARLAKGRAKGDYFLT